MTDSVDPRGYWSLLVLAAVALTLQFLVVPIDADVSWLITVSERVLAGQKLYVDVFEVNPPASVWLYLPQVALAHAIGARPETLIVIVTTLLAAASALVTARLCRGDETAPPPLLAMLVLSFVTLVLPGGLYAQREHFALLLMLPTAAFMAQIGGRAQSLTALILAGAAAGLVVVIKPHFLFAILLATVYAALTIRAWRSFWVAAAAGAVVVIAYAAAIFSFAPEYLAAIPMLAEAYGPMRDQLVNLLVGPAVLLPIALAALAWTMRPEELSRFQPIVMLALAGFTLAVLIQGKGYWNHALPGMGLGLVLLGWSVFSPKQRQERKRLGGAVFAFLALGLLYPTLAIQPPPGLVPALRAVAPPNPTVVTVGTELASGHPAVRLVDGQWAGSRAALFTAAGVRYRTANRTLGVTPQLERWYREDIDTLARDIAVNRPLVVLVEDKPREWLLREPAIAGALGNYRRRARAGAIEIWLRKDV